MTKNNKCSECKFLDYESYKGAKQIVCYKWDGIPEEHIGRAFCRKPNNDACKNFRPKIKHERSCII